MEVGELVEGMGVLMGATDGMFFAMGIVSARVTSEIETVEFPVLDKADAAAFSSSAETRVFSAATSGERRFIFMVNALHSGEKRLGEVVPFRPCNWEKVKAVCRTRTNARIAMMPFMWWCPLGGNRAMDATTAIPRIY